MRQTLRRSCAGCAKSKHSCDLRLPRCSRCVRRRVPCLYANEPWTATAPAATGSGSRSGFGDHQYNNGAASERHLEGPGTLTTAYNRFGSLDPFDSYPPTRLPREHVQRLIHGFLHKIAFQYYPLDLDASSNPFLVSWWPTALGDPALFHVSLQTACLDEELRAQKGFRTSELLMADSVALLRRKVQDSSLAVQDGTMNSVITLAAIEFGKGNIRVSQMHVAGARRLVDMRGGINSVRQTSPLTARMVSWVSMLVMGQPQFETQDDVGIGHGIPPIPEWQLDPATPDVDDQCDLNMEDIDYPVRNVLTRLRSVFHRAKRQPLPPTRFHDLTCFVVHRLLLTAPDSSTSSLSPTTECLRYAIILYMFTIQGPTYYSHAVILNTMVARLSTHLDRLESESHDPGSLNVWLCTIGMVAATVTTHHQRFVDRTRAVAGAMELRHWDDALAWIRSVLWLETPQGDRMFRNHWEAALHGGELQPDRRQAIEHGLPSSIALPFS
ncbi:hypothetical protein ACRE_038330 [Hapsidospora chrysogenum ATCC 11550]|uniref:Zn(2)-C6 fungal-type domain-containing protein n=1 Tax=Hapsidospora chrysogenum (strain ATCC 11550 / CBS 779.69 / DSM 880 / IAM 14645 / JCM 23072 / IMI 49137) TaxID=857340 RepID=A0A086T7R4_HAPC1|nr:hypothetical protein ACRE_038330 [Hapsidospora chrysogenum ATCC 11550]